MTFLSVEKSALFRNATGLHDLRTSGTGQDHVGVFAGGSDRGDGTTVANTGTLVDDLLRHF